MELIELEKDSKYREKILVSLEITFYAMFCKR